MDEQEFYAPILAAFQQYGGDNNYAEGGEVRPQFDATAMMEDCCRYHLDNGHHDVFAIEHQEKIKGYAFGGFVESALPMLGMAGLDYAMSGSQRGEAARLAAERNAIDQQLLAIAQQQQAQAGEDRAWNQTNVDNPTLQAIGALPSRFDPNMMAGRGLSQVEQSVASARRAAMAQGLGNRFAAQMTNPAMASRLAATRAGAATEGYQGALRNQYELENSMRQGLRRTVDPSAGAGLYGALGQSLGQQQASIQPSTFFTTLGSDYARQQSRKKEIDDYVAAVQKARKPV